MGEGEDDEEPSGVVAEGMVLKGSQGQIDGRTFEWVGRWIAVYGLKKKEEARISLHL